MRHAASLLIPSLLILVIAAAATTSAAQEIYKWTDENGDVHYGDRPTGENRANAETVAIVSRRTNSAAVSASVEARHEREAAREEARAERAEAEQAAAEAEREAAEREARCARDRATLETYVTSRRLYKMNDDGQREYLDDSQMQQARAELQQRIVDNCS